MDQISTVFMMTAPEQHHVKLDKFLSRILFGKKILLAMACANYNTLYSSITVHVLCIVANPVKH